MRGHKTCLNFKPLPTGVGAWLVLAVRKEERATRFPFWEATCLALLNKFEPSRAQNGRWDHTVSIPLVHTYVGSICRGQEV